MPAVFELQRQVEFVETDMAGIAHFSNFYRWMEQAEHAFFRSLDLTIVNHQSDGEVLGWPRVSCSCRFQSPVRYNDLLDIRIVVQRIGVKSLTYDVYFKCEGRDVAKGTMKTVCCRVDPEHGLTSVPIPEEYLQQLEEFQEPNGDS